MLKTPGIRGRREFAAILLLASSLGWTGSCARQKRPEANAASHTPLDYLDPESSPTARFHDAEYTLADDNVGWVHALYLRKDFSAIERQVTALLADDNEANSYALTLLYSSLARIPNGKHLGLMEGVLNEWCRNQPDSHIPWLVRGKFFINWGWDIRGTSFSAKVPEDAWPRFFAKLAQAKEDLERSWLLNWRDPNSSSFLITVAFSGSLPFDTMDKYYRNAIRACPWHYKAHYLKCLYLTPKWHGTVEEMNGFAEECLALSTQYPALGLIRALAYEQEQEYYNSKTNRPLQREEVWSTIQGGFDRYFEKYPDDLAMRFNYAFYAFESGRYEVACRQFARIGDRWIEETRWASLDAYNQSRAYSYLAIGMDLEFQQKRHQESLDYFLAAIAYHPSANAHYSLGIAYWNLGNAQRDVDLLRKAAESLSKAIELDSNHPYAQQQLTNLRSQLARL